MSGAFLNTSSPPNFKLQRATATIDELTKALSQFSRSSASTPEPFDGPRPACLCCESEGCETSSAWEHDRAKLVDRLVLSAEIGQALLERHEAYVADQSSLYAAAQERIASLESTSTTTLTRLSTLIRSSEVTEQRLASSQLNLDVSEASNRALLREVQENKSAIARLGKAERSREARIRELEGERDETRQERDALEQRNRALEARVGTLSSKSASLQTEVTRLTDKIESEGRRSPQRELSEELLRDARARLNMLQHSMSSQPESEEDPEESTRLLETLVADNEALKRDNAELRNFLSEARTEIRALSDEIQELRAASNLMSPTLQQHHADMVLKSSPPPSTPHLYQFSRRHNLSISSTHTQTSNTHSHTQSMTSPYRREGWSSSAFNQPTSPPPYQLGFSSTSSRTHSPRMLLSTLSPDPNEADARFSREPSPGAQSSTNASTNADTAEGAGDEGETGISPPKPKRQRTLMLLSRSRGVQTDPWLVPDFSQEPDDDDDEDDFTTDSLGALPRMKRVGTGHSKGASIVSDPSAMTDPTASSETSSLSGLGISVSSPPLHSNPASNVITPITELLEKMNVLLTRLNQTTVETLTARLKRQNLLAGSDISHLSRSSIAHIQADVGALRIGLKGVLDSSVGINGVMAGVELTRKDLRGLLRWVKDAFGELGRLRQVVNDIALDPSSAARVLAAVNAKEAPVGTRASPSLAGSGGGASDQVGKDRGWIAPITRLFAPSAAASSSPPSGGGTPADPANDTSPSAAGVRGSPLPHASPSSSGAVPTIKQRRPVPKLAPAVSSSSTTVNVEFATSRARRAVSSTAVAVVGSDADSPAPSGVTSASSFVPRQPPLRSSNAGAAGRRDVNGLLGIFAGAPAPRPESVAGESWVVLPRDPATRKLRNAVSTVRLTGDPSTPRRRQLSRNVDAIVENMGQRSSTAGLGAVDESGIADNGNGDGESHAELDDHRSVLERASRTLRPRGLSDSSIRSTYLAAGDDTLPVTRLLTPASLALSSADTTNISALGGIGVSFGAFDRQSVLKGFSKRMQSLASYVGASPLASVAAEVSTSSSSAVERRGSVVADASDDASLSQSTPPASSAMPANGAPQSPPRAIPSSSHRSQSPIASPSTYVSRSGARHSPSSSSASPARIPALSNILASIGDGEWASDSDLPHSHPPRRPQDDWMRRDRF